MLLSIEDIYLSSIGYSLVLCDTARQLKNGKGGHVNNTKKFCIPTPTNQFLIFTKTLICNYNSWTKIIFHATILAYNNLNSSDMTNYNQNSEDIRRFRGFPDIEEGCRLAGYSALIAAHHLNVPAPDHLCVIGTKHKKYNKGRWRYFTPRHQPGDTLYGHMTFALKYEGIDLALFHALFLTIDSSEIESIIRTEPTGSYSRRFWFLWEWLCEKQLNIEKGVALLKRQSFVHGTRP